MYTTQQDEIKRLLDTDIRVFPTYATVKDQQVYTGNAVIDVDKPLFINNLPERYPCFSIKYIISLMERSLGAGKFIAGSRNESNTLFYLIRTFDAKITDKVKVVLCAKISYDYHYRTAVNYALKTDGDIIFLPIPAIEFVNNKVYQIYTYNWADSDVSNKLVSESILVYTCLFTDINQSVEKKHMNTASLIRFSNHVKDKHKSTFTTQIIGGQ